MLNRSESSEARRQQLSSLMDGELPDDAAVQACALWRHDAAMRQDWHAYHLIGDVLRSDDLATRPARDESFLQALRLRLADEAVPLARAAPPTAQPVRLPHPGEVQVVSTVRAGRARSWLVAPAAVAAGFAVVAGVMVATRVSVPTSGNAVLALSTPAAVAASAVLVRDPQLDRYLSAHRVLAHGAMPGAAAEHRVQIVFEGQ